MRGGRRVARPDDRLLGTPQTAQEGTDGIIRTQQVRDRTLRLATASAPPGGRERHRLRCAPPVPGAHTPARPGRERVERPRGLLLSKPSPPGAPQP